MQINDKNTPNVRKALEINFFSILGKAPGVQDKTGLDLRENSYHFSFLFMLDIESSKPEFNSEQELLSMSFRTTLLETSNFFY